MKYKKVIAEIVEIETGTTCSVGHKVGEKFVFDENGLIDKNACVVMLKSIMLPVKALLKGQELPGHTKGEEIYWGCHHPGAETIYKGIGRVIFRLTPVTK
ncbi:MAG: TIGR04076 family protein [Candidatus Roizmanbacteria bacterium]|nr:MAG: TIGR04076 family protein [Candidatus Roizmanbacteria bacterium]